MATIVELPQPALSNPVNARFPPLLQAHATLALLMVVAVFGYADLHLFALLATKIKAAFALSDTQLGVVQGVAAGLTTAIVLIPVGALVDKVNRVRLLLAATAVWSVFTLLTGLSQGFWQMFASRIGVGVAEAAVYPAAYSLIADLYAPKQRALVISIFMTGTIAGSSVATSLSGMLIRAVDTTGAAKAGGVWAVADWRIVFLAAALPGLALLLGLAITREPARHHQDAPEMVGEKEQTFLQFLSRERALLTRLIGAIVLSQVALAPISSWLPAAFIRTFRFSAGQAGEWFGVIWGGGALTGVAVGTALASVVGRRDEAGAPLATLRIGVVMAAAAVLVIPVAGTATTLALAIAALIASIYVGMTVTPTLLVAVAPSYLRGRLIALESLVLLTMMACTPPLLGTLSDRLLFGPRALVQAISAVTVPCNLAAPLFLIGVGRLMAHRAR